MIASLQNDCESCLSRTKYLPCLQPTCYLRLTHALGMLLNVIFLFKQHFQRIVFGSCTSALHQFGVRFQQHQQLSDWPRGLAWMEPLVRGGPSCPSKAMSHETRLANSMRTIDLPTIGWLPCYAAFLTILTGLVLGNSKTSKDPKIL